MRDWRRGLYAIADTALIPADQLSGLVAAALQGGARAIQYRDKSSPPAQREAQARVLLNLCHKRGATFIINDDVDLCARIQADGVHLGQNDTALPQARARLGAGAIIGLSCYNQLPRALMAAEAGADYVAFGRFYPSRTKPEAVQADIDLLREARRRLALPIAVIGGITAQNGAALIEAGADLLAVIDGVFGQTDVHTAARNIAALFDGEATRQNLPHHRGTKNTEA